MPFQSAPNCAEAVITATHGGKLIANVLNFRKLSGYDQADIDALATMIDTLVGADYLLACATNVTYDGTVVRGLEDVIDLTGSQDAEAGPGTSTGASLPANVTLCFSLRSGFTGRSARGRFFAFPTSIANLTSTNTFSSGYAAAVEAFLDDVRAGAVTIGWEQVILSRFSLGAKRITAIATPVISAAPLNLTVDSQRHRLPIGH